MLIGRGVKGVFIEKNVEAGFDLTSILHPQLPISPPVFQDGL